MHSPSGHPRRFRVVQLLCGRGAARTAALGMTLEAAAASRGFQAVAVFLQARRRARTRGSGAGRREGGESQLSIRSEPVKW